MEWVHAGLMTLDEYLFALAADGARIAAVGDAAIGSRVPNCPEWEVADLIVHVGWVHQMLMLLAAVPDGGRATRRDSEPLREILGKMQSGQRPDGELLPWFRSGVTGLVDALEHADPTKTIQTYLGTHQPELLARRAATETAVHRWDAEGVAGVPTALTPALAEAAIDEFLEVLAPTFFKFAQFGGTGQSIRLEGNDRDCAWRIVVDADTTTVKRGLDSAAADVTARGSLSDLYLQLWGRQTASPLEVVGDADLLARWQAAGAF